MPMIKAPSPDQHVGIHMPTAYIRRITLDSSTTGGMAAEVQVVLKDILRGKDLFSDNMGFLKHLKIKVYQVRNSSLYNKIISGGPAAFTRASFQKSRSLKQSVISPFDYLGNDMPSTLRGFARSKDAAGNEFENFVYRVRFDIDHSDPKHLSYFARTEIDMSSAAEGEGIKSIDASGMMGSICGCVTGEKVIFDGKIQRDAYSFVVTDTQGAPDSYKDSIWPGPVHNHRTRGYMGGASHTRNPHPALRKDQTLNPKIIDKRSYNMLDDKAFLALAGQSVVRPGPTDLYADEFTNTREENYFSDPFMARNEHGAVSLTFSFDYSGYISKEARFRDLFSSRHTPVINYDNFFPVTNVEVYRHRTRTRTDQNIKSTNTLGTPRLPTDIVQGQTKVVMRAPGTNIRNFTYKWPVVSQDRPNTDTQTRGQTPKVQQGSSYTNTLEEIQITPDNSIKTWTITDADYSGLQDGEYQYEVVLTLEDRTPLLVDEAVKTMNQATKSMKQYEMASKLCKNYDAVHDKFYKSFKKRSKKYNWLQSTMDFVGIVETFYGQVDDDFRDNLVLLVNPVTGTPSGITQVLVMMDSLNSKVRSIYPDRNQPHTHRQKSSKLLQNASSRSQQVQIRKRFDDVYCASHPDSGLMYLGEAPITTMPQQDGLPDPGIRTLSENEYNRRIDMERGKYFVNGAKNSVRSIVPKLTAGSLDTGRSQSLLNNIEKTQTLYLTPSAIRSGKNVLTLLDKGEDLYEPDQYSLMTARLMDRTKRSQRAKVEKNKEFSQAINNILMSEGVSVDFDLLDRNSKKDVVRETLGSTEEGADDYFIESNTVLGNKRFNTKNIRNDTRPEYVAADYDERENLVKEVGKELLSSIVTDRGFVSAGQPRRTRREDKSGFKLSMKKYDPENNTSLLSKKKIKKISSLPMQNLSLIFARSPAVRKSWHELEIDLPKDGSYTEFYRYNYDAVMKVQYLEGYARSNGQIQLKKPIWKDLTHNEYKKVVRSNHPVVCRLEPYADSEFGIGQTNSLDVPIYNRYFMFKAATGSPQPERDRPRAAEDFRSRIGRFMYAHSPETVDYSRTATVDHTRMFRTK